MRGKLLYAIAIAVFLVSCSSNQPSSVSISGDRVFVPDAEIIHKGNVSEEEAVVPQGDLFAVIKDGQVYIVMNTGEEENVQLNEETSDKAIAQFIANTAFNAEAMAQSKSVMLATGIEVNGLGGDSDSVTFTNRRARWAAIRTAEGKKVLLAPQDIQVQYPEFVEWLKDEFGSSGLEYSNQHVSDPQNYFHTFGSLLPQLLFTPVDLVGRLFDSSYKDASSVDPWFYAQLNAADLSYLISEAMGDIVGIITPVTKCGDLLVAPVATLFEEIPGYIDSDTNPQYLRDLLSEATEAGRKCIIEALAGMASGASLEAAVKLTKIITTFSWALQSLIVAPFDTLFSREYSALYGVFATIGQGQFGTSADDYAVAIDLDESGYVYELATTFGTLSISSIGRADAYLRKVTPGGMALWTKQFGTEEDDWPHDLAIDASKNVVVVGTTTGQLPGQERLGGYGDVFVAKFDKHSNLLYQKQLGTNDDDRGYAIDVDTAGKVYIAGHTWGAFPGYENAGNEDVFVVCLSPDLSDIEWVTQFGSDVGDFVGRTAMSVRDGRVYIAGHTNGTLPGQTFHGGEGDAYVAVLDSATGSVQKIVQYGTSGNDYTFALAAAADAIFVAGYTTGQFAGEVQHGGDDYFVGKFDNRLNSVWAKQYGTSSSDKAWGIDVLSSGDVVVVGETGGDLAFSGSNYGGIDFFVQMIDSGSGASEPAYQMGSSADDSAQAVAAAEDVVHVVGWGSGQINFPRKFLFNNGSRDVFEMTIRAAK